VANTIAMKFMGPLCGAQMRSVGSSASHCMDANEQKVPDSLCVLSLGCQGDYCIEIPASGFENCAMGGERFRMQLENQHFVASR
jgi:hypothetical protein